MGKYYGIGPMEMEEMPVELFNAYLGNIAPIERLLNPPAGRRQALGDREPTAESQMPTTDTDILSLMRRNGLRTPQG